MVLVKESETMKRRQIILIAGLMLLMPLVLMPMTGVEAGRTHQLYLDDGEVVPEGSGNPNLFGEATIEANGGKGRLCYTIRAFIYGFDEEVTGVAIHEAPPGVKGPQRAQLASTIAEGETVGDCVFIGNTLAHDIQQNPEAYYLLVTTTNYPDGASRAQLAKSGN